MELVVRSSPQGAGRWTTAECFLFGTLTGATDPVAVGDREGIPVLPFGDSVLINVIVSNEGNEDES